jgi:hypothetical protein
MSWDTLISIAHYGRDLLDEEQASPPEACPIDGTPLVQGERGQLYCPFDEHYFWPQDGRLI